MFARGGLGPNVGLAQCIANVIAEKTGRGRCTNNQPRYWIITRLPKWSIEETVATVGHQSCNVTRVLTSEKEKLDPISEYSASVLTLVL